MSQMKERRAGKTPTAYAKRPALDAADGGAAAKKKRTEYGNAQVQYAENPALRLSKKERKLLSRERKARTNKNFTLIQEAVGLWETMRRSDTPPEKRSQLVTAIIKRIDGRAGELAASHTASRVVQACIKHGTPEERAKILKQLEPTLLPLAKSSYGRFVVSKIIDLAPKKDGLQVFLKAFRGHAAELLRHPAGTHVLDDLYSAATSAQRNAIAAEFYGREYSLFQDGTLNNTQGAPTSLHDLLSAVNASKRRSIIQYLAAAISPVIEKGLVDCQLAHRLIDEYLTEAPASLVADAVESLSGDALLHMLHTHHGCAASCMVLAYGTAKDRKKAVRALKGHVPAAMQDEWGHLAILTALSVVDDTSMLKKFVVAEIQKDVDDLVGNKAAHRVILQLLHPDFSRYLPPALATMVHPPQKILKLAGTGKAFDDSDNESSSDDDEEEDQVEDKEQEKVDGEEEKEEEEGSKAPVLGPLGVSKKDSLLRRKELLEGGLGEALVTLCAASGAELVCAQYAADVVAEVCRGGQDGVLEQVVGAAAIDAVHDTVIAAAAKGIESEDGGLLGSYWGSRAVRRLILASSAEGECASRFVEKLWSDALKGKCKELKDSHGAKVLAAVVHSGCAGAAKGAVAELKKAGEKKPTEWANKFLHK